MYTNILRSIAGIEIYPVFSLLLFFTLFCSVLIWAVRVDKTHLQYMSELPLLGDELVQTAKEREKSNG